MIPHLQEGLLSHQHKLECKYIYTYLRWKSQKNPLIWHKTHLPPNPPAIRSTRKHQLATTQVNRNHCRRLFWLDEETFNSLFSHLHDLTFSSIHPACRWEPSCFHSGRCSGRTGRSSGAEASPPDKPSATAHVSVRTEQPVIQRSC